MKAKRITGIVLIILGILLVLCVMGIQVTACMDGWHNEFKARTFDSFGEYFFSVSKGAIVISVLLMVVPAAFGVGLLYGGNREDC